MTTNRTARVTALAAQIEAALALGLGLIASARTNDELLDAATVAASKLKQRGLTGACAQLRQACAQAGEGRSIKISPAVRG